MAVAGLSPNSRYKKNLKAKIAVKKFIFLIFVKLMLKKFFIFLFLATAYSALMAHNFTPHHHDEELEAQKKHDDHSDDHKDRSDYIAQHSADFGKILSTQEQQPSFELKSTEAASFFSEFYNTVCIFWKPPIHSPPGKDARLHHIFYYHSVPLRAPPACLPA